MTFQVRFANFDFSSLTSRLVAPLGWRIHRALCDVCEPGRGHSRFLLQLYWIWYLIDSGGHSRFVLRISNLYVSSFRPFAGASFAARPGAPLQSASFAAGGITLVAMRKLVGGSHLKSVPSRL